MANGGINKAQVKKARDALLAKGQRPSLDAVRIELGNTGSKTTILKYMNELATESGQGIGARMALSDTLSDIVASLAAQLQEDAQAVVEESANSHQAEIKRLNDRIAEQQKLLTETENQCRAQAKSIDEVEQVKALLVHSEQELALKAERLTQQLASQQDLIAQKDTHIHSLEEKHQHARETLEHYRDSVKDQRDQEQRRQEHQVQQLQADIRQLNQTISVKQTDITQLNKDNSRLATEISEARKQLRTSEQLRELLASQNKTNEDALRTVTAQLAEAVQIQREIAEENTTLRQQMAALQEISQTMKVELITTKTELTVKNQLFESLRPQVQ